MVDVFVSYAKTDRSLASKLVAMLEAEGWKVWWDTTLAIGDGFRNEIMTELGRARAVIVIWTDASIKSDWVRSEAGRALADRKLIPVKLEHLTHKDLPSPFDVLHTENVGDDDKILAAVVAQFAKPAVEPTATALLTKNFKYDLLTWFGIIGGAFTLFTSLSAVLKLADWARVLVENWKEWTHAFWVSAFGWLGIHLSLDWTPVLSFLLFGSVLTIGQALKFRRTIKTEPLVDNCQSKSFQLISRRMFLFVVCSLIVSVVWLMVLLTAVSIFPDWSMGYLLPKSPSFALIPLYAPLLILVIMFARHRLHAAVTIFLMVTFWTIITFNQLTATFERPSVVVSAFAMILVLPVILLSVAPVKAVNRSLIFLAIGLILLFALDKLSAMGLPGGG